MRKQALKLAFSPISKFYFETHPINAECLVHSSEDFVDNRMPLSTMIRVVIVAGSFFTHPGEHTFERILAHALIESVGQALQ